MPDTSKSDLQQITDQIATALNETNPGARDQIHNLLQIMGVEFAQTVFQETIEIENSGGLMLPSGKRRRTLGGVFFFLAKQKLTPEQQEAVFPPPVKSPPPLPTSPAAKPAISSEPRPEIMPGGTEPDPFVYIEITPEMSLVAANIAGQLKETDPERLATLTRIIQVGGMELARKAMAITLEMETQGGTRKKDGTRRSPCGAFLYIASRRLTEEQRRRVWPELPEDLVPPIAPPTPKQAVIVPASKPPVPAGTATTAKMTLVGRPASVVSHIGFVEFQLENNQAPNLPRGLPTPVGTTIYTIYVNDKQWSKVAEAAENPLDTLIIEGYPMALSSTAASPVLEVKTPGVILFATNIVSKLAQQYKKSMVGE